ncbi:histidine kinase-, DNA gyrase b-, and HSP90-like ATPase domain-containing protein [Hirsutella rhossiliensis]|uniref:Histidine kinase-, DNA gyrase b-, and HSP90-like ATPase domain-containing protein n=1 Tax=Hirsutella rhossiliensis TaxID=111463 RepID=A0A9P8N5V9_9HYPO|nr:histidine kinase-, DNA gyrase b-, and HSP90-like ATPase domain-containing protein [Hirsutella rhossiliensis]KAH0966344.1 histidine kinase-, DNA gyrase b-, and HSP90-like ATPase domain-containing protein [Hirsutella rhossiliensis]
MSIRQLPEDVAAKIRSSAAITSLNHVVSGLLKNSLDAGANKIHVRLDYARGNCIVEDDGLGIEPREFRPDGGLGKCHHTSRCPPSPRFHGCRGDFLVSVANLSLLSVTSHHHRHLSQSFLSIHNSKVLTRQLPASPEQRLETFSHGTRVSVHALFGSMPVRVKHQATVFSGRSGVDKQWGLLAREMVALLLAWPSEVSVSLTETAARLELRLKSTANIDILLRTSRLFTQASLADSDDANSWRSVSASARHIRIKGCISTTPAATRRSQTMSLGIQPILNNQDNNALYEAVNDVFRTSSFGVVEDDGVDAPRHSGFSAKPRKGLERWPMFYLQITLPSADMIAVDDILNDSHKTLGNILDLLRAVSYEFLKKQSLRPRAIVRSTEVAGLSASRPPPKVVRPTAQSPLTNSETRSGSPFNDWNRVKVGWAAPRSKERGVAGGQKRRLDTATLEREAKQNDVPRPGPMSEAEEESSQLFSNTNGQLPDDSTTRRQRKKVRALENRTKPQPSKWLQGVLQSWENPVFEAAQKAIPSLYETGPTADAAHACRGKGHVRFDTGSMSLAGRLSRSALGDAQVIAQVDRKFILVRLPLESALKTDQGLSSAGLVMIDQHAADERCRLEELLEDYFEDQHNTGRVQPVVEALDRPVVFEASGREGELLQQYGEHFEAWGVMYKVQRGPRIGSACQVQVTGLPPSILERCRSEPRVLIDLVRKEAWALADDKVVSRPRGVCHGTDKSWTSRFRGCPSGILKLLYSRSCRSAIMFNDELSRDECARLVLRLSRCAFPFQCAHGRPSMVPLADLGSGAGRIWRDGPSVGVQGWKRWMEDDG